MNEHTYSKCTRKTCEDCGGRGNTLDTPFETTARLVTCPTCGGDGTTRCGGCRPDTGMDCNYDALAICATCGGSEGSLLPFCPGRLLSYEEDQQHYEHYLAGTGPFARCVPLLVTAAKTACYCRLHPLPTFDSSRGSRILYDAVCELWKLVMKRVTNAASA